MVGVMGVITYRFFLACPACGKQLETERDSKAENPRRKCEVCWTRKRDIVNMKVVRIQTMIEGGLRQ